MEAIADGRGEYAATLVDLGFLPGSYLEAVRHGTTMSNSGHDVDDFSNNARVVKAAVCGGFYPNIVMPVPMHSEADMHAAAIA